MLPFQRLLQSEVPEPLVKAADQPALGPGLEESRGLASGGSALWLADMYSKYEAGAVNVWSYFCPSRLLSAGRR